MQECINYLKEAKAKQWTIDMGDLAYRFKLTHQQVRECISKVYGI